MALSKDDHRKAAELAREYLPEYMGQWVAGVLLETHTLPPLIDHQDKLTIDVMNIALGKLTDELGD